MANSTTNLDTISSSQAQKEVTANAVFDAASPATLFGRRATTTAALTWGVYGGTIVVDGVLTQISNTTVALTASQTNYVEATRAGAISANTTGYTAGRVPLYTVVTGSATITSYTDHRAWVLPAGVTGRLARVIASDANITLTAAEARNSLMDFTSSLSLTATRDVVLPLGAQQWTVYNNTTGAQSLRFIGATGTGVTVANGSRAIVYADGTNVVAASADQTITLTGDVTGSGTGSFAATIANDAVTYAKIQNISTNNRLLGRATAGAGDAEEITLGTNLSFAGNTLNAAAGGAAPFIDSTAIIKGSADDTKLLRIEVDGFTTGTTRVATPPNADFTMAGLELTQTFTASQTWTGTANRVGTATTNDALADTMMSASATTKKALVLQMKAVQTAHALSVQTSAGVACTSVQSDGGLIVDQRTSATYSKILDVLLAGTRKFAVTTSATEVTGDIEFQALANSINFAGGGRLHLTNASPYPLQWNNGTIGNIKGYIGGGAAVASAAALPLPTGRVFHVTGTTTITSITSTNFQNGVVITLIFDGVLTVTDGSNLKLAGNFVTAADATLGLVFDGTNWYETSRSTN